MKVLFILHSTGKASGGHYHSLNHISRVVGRELTAGVITVGSAQSPVLADNPYFIRHVVLQKTGDLPGFFSQLRELYASFEPDVLHFFDTESLNFLLLIPATTRYPLVMSKCGGPNPMRKKWQQVDDLILFSGENYEWFRHNHHYKKTRIHLIPNRVSKLGLLPESKRAERKDDGVINFVRVSRLGGAYEKTLMDSFNLIEKLSVKYKVHFYVIGRIQDEARFQVLRKYAEDKELPVEFITDERASKGADFLYLADFVVGTGRSLIEALSLGIPCLTPAANCSMPVLVTRQNFDGLFATNFSERNRGDDETLATNLDNIERLIEEKEAYQEARKTSLTFFENYFDVERVTGKYVSIYNISLNKAQGLKLVFRNFPYVVKSLLGLALGKNS
ncbi:glycosyltransferase family 4 protein [Imperialibacter roseus]|uniref:Glycosyltransferase family 4 protein n=1 Tax=Imperialibacter roseus TaxID=1324217 RepID=A0ABZ0IK23_9BACT|nr:glycosyltransferase family 4 protein [Imperialibacter roseus]WOK05372.1 glycosyltransferase family 4 protein [Imperialibacter roseus]